jgi:hypothetical protein
LADRFERPSDIAVAEHHAFGRTGAGGVDNRRHVGQLGRLGCRSEVCRFRCMSLYLQDVSSAPSASIKADKESLESCL